MSNKIEVLHNHELVSFEVRLQDIQLSFGPLGVDFSSSIEIIPPEGQGKVEMIESVWNRTGNLDALWPLIGKRMEKLVMDEEAFRIMFEDGTIIRRKFEPRSEVVNFWGPGPNNFTRYPDALYESKVSPEEKQRIIGAMVGRKVPW